MHIPQLLPQLLFLLGATGLNLVAATPIPDSASTTDAGPLSSALMKRATPEPPHFVVYIDNDIEPGVLGLPTVDKLKGFNVVNLAFLFSNGTTSPYSQAAQWQQMNASARADIKAKYAAAGIKILVSLGGDQDHPTSKGKVDPKTAGSMAANWVKDNGLDGIDIDYEDFDAMPGKGGEQWLIDFTTQLRSDLGNDYLITHAPIAGWFAPNLPGGAYRTVDAQVGKFIDWYNIQFYNSNGQDTTCDNLLNKADTSVPGSPAQSSLFEINTDAGIPLAKIVLGKPETTADSKIGVLNATYLGTCVQEAQQKQWNGGLMLWQYSDTASGFIQEARKRAFPLPA
ncbi:glycoside hydrolase family 18 protein [Mycena polygramma]|nr:glycoside hydrolase family 18 protein [Mycena polygramma]